jgi:predicted porin
MDGVSIGYAHTIKDPKTGSDKTGNEYIASYQMTDKLKLLGGYGKIKDGNTYMTAGTHYNVNKKVTLYTEFQSVDVKSGTDTTGISTGIKFKF